MPSPPTRFFFGGGGGTIDVDFFVVDRISVHCIQSLFIIVALKAESRDELLHISCDTSVCS